MDELRECPFCGEEVEYYEDDYGGSWVEHKIKHVDGKKDPCILTNVQVDYSAEQGKDWNHRAVKPLDAGEIEARIYYCSAFLQELIDLKSFPNITSNSENATTKSDKIEEFITKYQDDIKNINRRVIK